MKRWVELNKQGNNTHTLDTGVDDNKFGFSKILADGYFYQMDCINVL
jgi:hypothetical protein